ncbi:CDC27 family protein [Colwellia sp. RE-S-Sl-9]
MRINSIFPLLNLSHTDNEYTLVKYLANQTFSLHMLCVVIILGLSFSTNKAHSKESSTKVELNTKQPLKQLPEHLSEKFYRQALYYYFQNKPDEALSQLNINDEYFTEAPVHASLFRAGLQISQGLPEEAQKLLEQLSKKLSNESADNTNQTIGSFFKESSDHDTIRSNVQKDELMIIVLLQLAEQKITQQNSQLAKKEAQDILNNIHLIPAQYIAQYYLLQQLIAWPQQPNIEDLSLAETSKKQLVALLNNDTQAPYLLLNEALRAMSQQEYVLAEQKLKVLQAFKWQQKTNGFWQQLFANELKQTSKNREEQQSEQKIEQNGIHHYAQLLLAQLYLEQGLFQQGYNQLESFPKHSPFTEQALFLFGYSAFKLNKFKESEVVFNTLITDYPYSTFTQQTWALSAEQYIAQNKLNLALNRYLHIEKYYENKQHELNAFKQLLNTEDNLLNLYQALNVEGISKYDVWLQASLKNTPLSITYQQLLSVDTLIKKIEAQQNRSTWLANTITLNNARQNKIRANQSKTNYLALLEQLADKKAQLSQLLNKIKAEKLKQGNGELFANNVERKWLTRIENSKRALTSLQLSSQNSSKNKKAKETKAKFNHYQQRLVRVQGVLTWQLQQKLPERFWQSQESLNHVEELYTQTMQQYKRVDDLLSKKSVLTGLSLKHQSLTSNIASLLEITQQLKDRLNVKLLEQNQQFVKNEQRKIQQFLLFNQRAMANVIESLNQREAL